MHDQSLEDGHWWPSEIAARHVAGVDEVGRGPLAGDVVAAAVVLNPEVEIKGLADSKKLSEKKREQLFDVINRDALAVCIGRASVEEIDRLNILWASMLAMKRAVEGLRTAVDFVLVDGNRLPDWQYRGRAIVKGDQKVACISAASVIAKVQRDREMQAMASEFPGYGFEKHKGYPTKAHLQALSTLGVSDIHRRSFGPVAKIMTA